MPAPKQPEPVGAKLETHCRGGCVGALCSAQASGFMLHWLLGETSASDSLADSPECLQSLAEDLSARLLRIRSLADEIVAGNHASLHPSRDTIDFLLGWPGSRYLYEVGGEFLSRLPT